VALQRGIWLEIYAVYQLLGAVLARSLEQDPAGREFALYSTLNGLERATPTQVSRVLGLRLTTASAQLNRLVERGHARRVDNPNDGRSHFFELTPEGRSVTLAHNETFGAVTRRVRSRLTVPEPTVREGLVALEEALREELRALEPAEAPEV
jgi:DNA-binding MarR family transcriptional regulator